MTAPVGRATLAYYKASTRELGNELPTPATLTTNVQLDLRNLAGTASVKQRMNAQLAWLLEEGAELPVTIDPRTGLATGLDTEALAAELAGRQGEVSQAARDQSSLRYALPLPTSDEVAELKQLPGKALEGLRAGWRRRKQRSD